MSTQQNNPSPIASSHIQMWGPDHAEKFLANMIHNRPVTNAMVERYANSIRAGDWVLNGEPIIYDEFGRGIDGQHRALAVIKAGMPIATLVVSGVNHQVFSTINTGRTRSAGDILGLAGISPVISNTVAAAARLFFLSKSGVLSAGRMSGKDSYVSSKSILDVVQANPGLLESVNACAHGGRPFNGGLFAFCHYAFGQIDAPSRDLFFAQLWFGEQLTASDPAYLLRERLIKNIHAHGVRLSQTMKLALTVKAWNFHVSGRSMRVLRWTDDEEFPQIY